jgi:DNA-directed RNA polymerase specialized sigma24 family protein
LNEFSSKLDKEQYRLLILASGFELTTTAIAHLFNCNQSTIWRQVNEVKKDWLIEQLEKLGMNQRAAELRAGARLNRQTSKSINEVWKTRESHFSSLIYQQFERGWQQLEPPSPQLLELRFAKQQEPVKIAEQLQRDVAEVEERIAEAVGNLEGVLLDWTEQKFEKPLAACEPLKKKISKLVEHWLVVGSYLANLR